MRTKREQLWVWSAARRRAGGVAVHAQTAPEPERVARAVVGRFALMNGIDAAGELDAEPHPPRAHKTNPMRKCKMISVAPVETSAGVAATGRGRQRTQPGWQNKATAEMPMISVGARSRRPLCDSDREGPTPHAAGLAEQSQRRNANGFSRGAIETTAVRRPTSEPSTGQPNFGETKRPRITATISGRCAIRPTRSPRC